MKIADATSFAVPVGGAAAGLLASKVIPSTLKLESTYMKAGANIGLGLASMYLAHRRDGKDGDFIHYVGLTLLAMGGLELIKNFLPVSWQTGISDYPVTTYQTLTAYPQEEATRQAALPEGFGDTGDISYGVDGVDYSYGASTVSY